MRKVYILLLCLLQIAAFAQTRLTLTGAIHDDQGKGLPNATVSLLRAKDSSLVKTAVSNKEGVYELVGISPGQYLLQSSCVGYRKMLSGIFTAGADAGQLPTMAMQLQAKDLGGVTVTAQKPFIETKLDKTVVNVEASPTSAGATALDILEKSPGIMVNSDGVISLRGKQGVIVMMDGKPTFLSPADLASLLRNMPASALEQVEIMTNPSSKFDASGNSGVINIKTKKGRNAGFNGSVMVGLTSSIYQQDGETVFIPKSQNSVNFNYKKNKLNFFGNYNPNFSKGRNQLHFDGRFLDGSGHTTGYSITDTRFQFRNNNHTLKLGVDWYANKKNVLGFVVSGFSFQGYPEPNTQADIQDASRNITSRLLSYTENDIQFKNLTSNINWKHSFDSTGKELTVDADWASYKFDITMQLTTDYLNSSLHPVGRTYLKGDLPADINIYSLKSDYTLPFKGGRFEAGFKASYVINDNTVVYLNSMDKLKWMMDTIRSNHFIYKENINAAYVNYNRQIKKWTVQAGLRVENTIANGHQVVSDVRFKRNMTDLFPTAYVSYALHTHHTLSVNFGRRIQRPNYQDLNPFIFFLDTLSYRQGNIYLKPQYTYLTELSHAFKGKYITTLNYSRTNDVISQIIRPLSDTSLIRFLTVDNVSRLTNYGIAVTAPFTLSKWWNLNLFTNVFNNRYEGMFDTFRIDMSYTSFMVNLTNNFTLGKGYTAELSGFYRSRGLNNLSIMNPLYQMSIGLQKQVMKGKGTVRLNVRDPFAWQVFSGYNRYGLIDNHFSFRPDIRQVTGTFTWRFGSNGQNNQPRKRASGSQDEQSRVGGGNQ